MRKQSKRFRADKERIEKGKKYEIEEALKIMKGLKGAKFDETVEMVVKLGVDPKKSDQLVRGSVVLPRGLGKEKKVLVFAEGDKALEAKDAGADFVGGEEMAKKIQEGFQDFDVAIAIPGAMRYVGRLGKILGPQGKMPSPKSGTVTDDIGRAVKEFKAGKIEYRIDDGANVHVPVGKKSFSEGDLRENALTFIEHLKHSRPPGAKGVYIQKVVLSTTMGPGFLLNIT